MLRRFVALGAAAALLASSSSAQQPQGRQDVERIVAAAQALVATVESGPGPVERVVGYDRRAGLLLPFDDPAKEQWAYWPTARAGLPLELMTAGQRALAHDLLRAVLSSKGHAKIVNIMQLEEILKKLDDVGLPRDVGHYAVVIFGVPSTEEPWAWRFEGHHVSLSVTVTPDGIAVTPSFLGANPGEIRSGPLAGYRVLATEEDLARELVRSLTDAQRERAVLSAEAPSDIMTGNIGKARSDWDAWRTALEPEGIPVAALNEMQRHWVRRILDEVMTTYRPEISEGYLRGVDVDSLSFAWLGSVERGAPHYYRLQGPDFLFEFDNVQNDGNHVHSVWRSKAGDFGADLLATHYQAFHR
ncbi:MAG: DUF3500 domain-containing protein [Gammaproteobacteria bacterium]|nr:DUF3500 domain-containing protein [Gammaproteobacteria bacterium]